MSLVVYNTLSGKKEKFTPISPPNVGMYVCGITAYDTCHMGHARAAVVFDVICRYLKFSGYDVTYVQNYTDVDDKIIKKANAESVSCDAIAERYIAEYEADMKSLGIIFPDITPKATMHIADMIAMIEMLVDKEMAYEVDGNVFFSVRKFKDYGKLSGKRIEDLESGARIEIDDSKRDPLDFALWKRAKEGEPRWASPWGEGRPGWHIECSAMSTKYLGQPFDIHGGGRDLSFPHHENEIAQAEGANGKEFVKYWLHNGFINMGAEKMSKSLGNITSIRSVILNYDYEAVRMFLLSNHYRSPIDYTANAMRDASSSLDRFYTTVERVHKIHPGKPVNSEPDDLASAKELKNLLASFEVDFNTAMDDDFNTAIAIAKVFGLVKSVNRYLDDMGERRTSFSGWAALQFLHIQDIADRVLGMFGSSADEYNERKKERVLASKSVDEYEIKSLLNERHDARTSRDFNRADEIRDELADRGIVIKDLPDGTTEWRFE